MPKKKTEQLLELWTNLKTKLMTTITELQELKVNKTIVYRSNAAPQKVPSNQALSVAESDQFQLGLLLKDLGYTSLAPIIDIQELKSAVRSFTTDKERYQKQLESEWTKYQRLETKLEQVRNLIADNQLAKLITLMKRGEI